MELMFATLGGAILGLGLRYVFPHRETYGALLLPAVGASVAAVVWAALTWANWKFDGGWIWVVSLVAAVIVSAVVALLLPRTRKTADTALFDRMMRA
jgi:hypothetical protein